MTYPLEELLKVRVHREEAAQIAVTAQRAAVEHADATVQARRQELADYIEYCKRREAEMYEDIMDREVQMRDLDDLKLSISLLQQRQHQIEDQVQSAQQELKQAQAELAQAQADLAAAAKDRRKIDEHKSVWSREEARRAEAEVEKEMEDFRVRKAEDASATL